MLLTLTKHATDRWRQRVPWLEPDYELRNARPASNRMRNLLLQYLQTPRKVVQGKVSNFPRGKFMTTPGGATLVVGDDGKVITVFRTPKKRAAHKTREWAGNRKPPSVR